MLFCSLLALEPVTISTFCPGLRYISRDSHHASHPSADILCQASVVHAVITLYTDSCVRLYNDTIETNGYVQETDGYVC